MEASQTSWNQLPAATGLTVEEYKRTLTALAENLLQIKKMTEKYPVFLVIAGRGYRFESPEHVDLFVATLRREVDSYRPSARAAAAV